ncbi:ubiquitin carboxyl-terminal hydrolase 51-like [Lynx rufus]|uniref:ubiquitin carboxyl-terminal hydrolase 51-like n=1 Tax=Lynx rufus TaxID=61384 RepID=UPI001F12581B|nr:ubiquitin carboxyl-terminal hydrolase 51-like [Lynx rufus]
MAPLRSGPSESWRPAPRRYIYPRSALPAIGSAAHGVGPRSLAPSCRPALRPMARSPGSRLPPPPLARPRRPSSPPPGTRSLAAFKDPAPRCPACRRRRSGFQAPWSGKPSKEAQGHVRRGKTRGK